MRIFTFEDDFDELLSLRIERNSDSLKNESRKRIWRKDNINRALLGVSLIKHFVLRVNTRKNVIQYTLRDGRDLKLRAQNGTNIN